MFLLSHQSSLCPPDSRFSLAEQDDFSLAHPPSGHPFLALWGTAQGICRPGFKVACVGNPLFPDISGPALSTPPCTLLAELIAQHLETYPPEHILSTHAVPLEGSFIITIWNTKNNTKWVYAKGMQCFSTDESLTSITAHPFAVDHNTLFLIPDSTICSCQKAPQIVQKFHQSYTSLDPLKPLHRAIFSHDAPIPEPITKVICYSEGIGLCVARMIKDYLEHQRNIAMDILPLTSGPIEHTPSPEQPLMVLPDLFSMHAKALGTLSAQPHTYILQPQSQTWADTFAAPLLHPLQQWVRALSLVQGNALHFVDGEQVLKMVSDFAPFLNLMKNSYRLYLGRHILSAFARVCAYYDHSITLSHAMHYPAGELKHGPLALVDPSFMAIIFCPYDDHFQKNINNAKEILARQGHVLALTDPEGSSHLKREGIPFVTIQATTLNDFIALSWLCLHRLMFLLEV